MKIKFLKTYKIGSTTLYKNRSYDLIEYCKVSDKGIEYIVLWDGVRLSTATVDLLKNYINGETLCMLMLTGPKRYTNEVEVYA